MRVKNLVVIAFLWTAPVFAGEGVLFVDDDAPGKGDGQSWDTAYRFLHDAITWAADPANGVTEIRVAQGAYKPDRDEANPDGTGDRNANFELITGVTLAGGFAGLGAEDPDDHDPDLYQAVLSADLLGDDTSGDTIENARSVLSGVGVDESVIDGFVVRAGRADTLQWGPGNRGGGLYIRMGSVTVQNCTFEDNVADSGGAITARASTLTLKDCEFLNNMAVAIGSNERSFGAGGAVLAESASSLEVVNCTFIANTLGGTPFDFTYHGGGAIAVYDSQATLDNCTVTGSTAQYGGALAAMCFDNQLPQISVANCDFSENDTTGRGGAVFLRSDLCDGDELLVAEFENCTFQGNTSSTGGGALYGLNVDCTLTGCVLADNELITNTGEGGGFWFTQSNATFTACAIEGNLVLGDGGGGWALESTLQFDACSFTGNASGSQGDDNGGGGLYCEKTLLTMTDCEFSLNSTPERGGGLHCQEDGALTLIGCDFTGNSAADCGGASYVAVSGATTISDCTFIGNEAENEGGAILYNFAGGTISSCLFESNTSIDAGGALCLLSGVAVADCTFRDNTCSKGGGGAILSEGATITDCLIENNTAAGAGGGMSGWGVVERCVFSGNAAFGGGGYSGDASTLVSCVFMQNSAETRGGGLGLGGGDHQVVNCLFIGNFAEQFGGAVYADGPNADSNLVNCTIVFNDALDEGGGVFSQADSNGETVLGNSILWGNTDSTGQTETAQVRWINGDLVVDRCCIQGWTGEIVGGVGNINRYPVFVEGVGADGVPGTKDDDYHLAAGSPCIDAGDNSFLPPRVLTDLDGNPRFLDDPNTDDAGAGDPPIVDMGVYEADFFLDCNGNDVPDELDILDGTSADCNGNAIPDECDVVPPFVADSGQLTPIGFESPQTFEITSPPVAQGDVTLSFSAVADLLSDVEFIDVELNGVFLATVFADGAHDCPARGDIQDIILEQELFNEIVGGGDASISMIPSGAVNAASCDGASWISVSVEYSVGGTSEDDNNNGIPDECEVIGDLDGDGDVDAADLILLLGAWGACDDCANCPADLDGDCDVDGADLILLLGNWGR